MQSNASERFYIGFTSDLRRRMEEHNSGSSKSTAYGIPWKLIYYEVCVNKLDAKRRERYLKTSQGYRLLKRRLKEYVYTSTYNESVT